MAVSKKRKKVNSKRKVFYKASPATRFTVNELLYRKVTVKWLPNTDEFQVFFDLYLNGKNLTMLGSIDPDKSYDNAIRIVCKNPKQWMTLKEIQFLQRDAPGIFAVLKAYFCTVGDVLDGGAQVDEILPGICYNGGQLFKDSEIVELFKYDLPLPKFDTNTVIYYDNFYNFILASQDTRDMALKSKSIGKFNGQTWRKWQEVIQGILAYAKESGYRYDEMLWDFRPKQLCASLARKSGYEAIQKAIKTIENN